MRWCHAGSERYCTAAKEQRLVALLPAARVKTLLRLSSLWVPLRLLRRMFYCTRRWSRRCRMLCARASRHGRWVRRSRLRSGFLPGRSRRPRCGFWSRRCFLVVTRRTRYSVVCRRCGMFRSCWPRRSLLISRTGWARHVVRRRSRMLRGGGVCGGRFIGCSRCFRGHNVVPAELAGLCGSCNCRPSVIH